MPNPSAGETFANGVANWVGALGNPNAGGGTRAPLGSIAFEPGNLPTQPAAIYLKLNGASPVGWTLQNLVNLNVFNVKNYGAVGDGITDDTAAINTCIAAANAAGGGIVYFPPTGAAFYAVVKRVGTPSVLPLSNVHNLLLLGDGYASKIKQIGSASGGETHLFDVHNGSSQIRFENFYMDVDNITSPDPDSQNHGIQNNGVGGESAGCNDIAITGMWFGRFVGDAVRNLGASLTLLVDNVRISHCAFDLNNGVVGSRCGVEAQRYTRHIQIHFCWFTGSHDQQIDFEPTGGLSDPGLAAPEEWSMIGNIMDHNSQTPSAFSLSGNGSTNPALRNLCVYNTIDHGGTAGGLQVSNLLIHGNVFTVDNTANGLPVFALQQEVINCTVDANVFVSQNDTGGNRPALEMTPDPGPPIHEPIGCRVSDNILSTVMNGVAQVVQLEFMVNSLVDGNVIVLNAPVSAGNAAMVQDRATIGLIANISFIGNLAIAIGDSPSTGFEFSSSNSFGMGNVLASFNMSVNCDHVVIFNVGTVALTQWRAANDNNCAAGSGASSMVSVPQLPSTVGVTHEGSAGPGTQFALYSTSGATPEGQVTAPVGSMANNILGTAATILSYKETGAGNTGWHGIGGLDVVLGCKDTTNATTAVYLAPGGQALATAQATEIQIAMPRAGTLRNLRLKCTGGSNDATYTYTLRVNGESSAVTFTVAGGATSGSDTTHSVSAAAGDLVSVQITKSATPATTVKNVSVTFEVAD